MQAQLRIHTVTLKSTDQNPLVSRGGGPGPRPRSLLACLGAAVSGEESQAEGPGCFSPSGPPLVWGQVVFLYCKIVDF